MDPSKKRKTDENGTITGAGGETTSPALLTPEDARKIIEPLTQAQLLDILQTAVVFHSDVLDAVRAVADSDPAQRKLFIRGLGLETTTERLRSVFSVYGDLEEAIVIVDKSTGKSKGYGFVSFKHVDGALLALKEPSKKIDGRMTVAQLAAMRSTAESAAASDVANRKIFVGSVPVDMSSERLLGHFAMYGEIEEGPLGFDKQTGKSRGFAFFVYKTGEGAKASLVEPVKNIDGHQVACKFAVDNKKAKTGAPATPNVGNGMAAPPPSSMLGSQYGYGGFSGGQNQVPPALPNVNHNLNSHLPPAIGGPGVGNQMASSMSGGGGGYGSNLGAGYGGGGSQYGGLNNAGSSMYRAPPSSAGMPSGGYPNNGHYGLPSSAFPTTQQLQPPPVPRIPPGGMYQNMPPYY